MNRKILTVVDMQVGFITCKQSEELVDSIINLIKDKEFDTVIGTRFINDKNSLFRSVLKYTELSSEDDIKIEEGIVKYIDYIVNKTTYSAVNREFIGILKRCNGGKLPKEVYICGLDTDGCVLGTVIDLFDIGIVPKVLSRYCCSTGGIEYHKAGLKCIERCIGKSGIL